jgi:hypothetical protein
VGEFRLKFEAVMKDEEEEILGFLGWIESRWCLLWLNGDDWCCWRLAFYKITPPYIVVVGCLKIWCQYNIWPRVDSNLFGFLKVELFLSPELILPAEAINYSFWF